MNKRILFSVTVITLAVLISGAMAQDKGRRGGRGGFGGFGPTNLVTLASSEAVQKDLGLSGDVTGKLTSVRDDYRAAIQKEYQTAGINFQDFQNITNEQRQKMAAIGRKLSDEFNPKVKELVSADQYKRLKQIQLQANLRNQPTAALTDAEVAAELKLTDEQKKKLDDLNAEFGQRRGGGGGGAEAFAQLREERTNKTLAVLTADQKAKLETLKGSAFDVSQLGFGGGRRGKN